MLRWSHDWGASQEHWNTLIELGRPVPEPFLDQPEILPESMFYWSAYCNLVTERQIGMGIGPIPISKAREYAEREGISDREWDDFWGIIREVDADHIRLINKPKEDVPVSGKSVSVMDAEGMKEKMERLKVKQMKLKS